MYKDRSVKEIIAIQSEAIQKMAYMNSLLKKQTKA